MEDFRLPAETHIGHVHLQVPSLDAALRFYQGILGLRAAGSTGPARGLSATGEEPYHVLLSERPGASARPAHSAGLYHVAIRLPGRQALARLLRRLLTHNWPLLGFADHGVSAAAYLADADGLGLELYADTPRAGWRWQDGQVMMATGPLDVAGLLRSVEHEAGPWTGIDRAADVGHVHLQVADLARAEAFYHGLLGFDVTQRSYPGALFLSAGGYHHHVGVNTWHSRGAPRASADAVGLRSFALRLPDDRSWRAVVERVMRAGLPVENSSVDGGCLVRDPDGNGVELLVGM